MGSRVRFDPSQDALWLGGTSGMKRDDQHTSNRTFRSTAFKRRKIRLLKTDYVETKISINSDSPSLLACYLNFIARAHHAVEGKSEPR
eukprot:bmy_00355T0